MAWPLYRPLIDATAPVLAASPKAFWRFEDDLTDDASVGPYDLALSAGTEAYADAGNGRTVFSFDGSTYLSATGYKGITGSSPRAVSAWIKSTGGEIPIITWGGDDGSGTRWRMRIWNVGGVVLVDCAGGNVIGSIPVNDGEWHHVVHVLDSGDTDMNLVRIYVDGVQDPLASSASQAINTSSSQDVEIGWASEVGSFFDKFDGLIDEVAIFDGLTDDEIAAIYKGGRAAGEAGFFWKESTEEWVTEDMPRSGGRYKTQLVTVSDQGKVYFGAF